MIKILLYISLLLTTSVASGNSLPTSADVQLAQILDCSEPPDDKRDKNFDSPEAAYFDQNIRLLQKTTPAPIRLTKALYQQFTSASYLIRAPPSSC